MADKLDTSSNWKDGNLEVTDHHKDMAQIAHLEFTKGNYSAVCVQLGKLQAARPKDIKVLLNKAVADYYKSGLKKTDAFRKALLDICTQASINLNNGDSYCVEASVLRLNHCISSFYMQRYTTASAVLEEMFKSLQTLDEKVGVTICLLLAECYLEMFEPCKTLAVVREAEAAFLPAASTGSPTSGSKQTDGDKESKSPEGQSIKDLSRSSSSSTSSSDPIVSGELKDSADQELLRGKLQILRARAVMTMRLYRQMKKEMKAINPMAGNQQNASLLMMKGLLEYLKGAYEESMKIISQWDTLSSDSSNFHPSLRVIQYNNTAIAQVANMKPRHGHLQLRDCFLHLEKELAKDIENTPLYARIRNDLSKLYYNYGVILMMNREVTSAFQYLLFVAQKYPSNPRLWLRIAECCISVHRMNLKYKQETLAENMKIHYTTEDGRIVISLSTNVNNHDKDLADQQRTIHGAVPEPTLEFARMCLRNALYLLPEDIPLDNFNEDQESISGPMPTLFKVNPSKPIGGLQLMQVKLASLTNYAYVSLCLGDYTVALRYGQTLLSLIPKVPRLEYEYKFLCHLYCGEALVKLGRITEAATHFDPYQVGEANLPEPQPDINQTLDNLAVRNPYSPMGGSIHLRFNLAAAYALRGQFPKSLNILKDITSETKGKIPVEFQLLEIYIYHEQGNMDMVENVLKREHP